MGPKLHNAVGFYLDGVRDGHIAAALDKYVSAGLVQHMPGVRGGREGLADTYGTLVDRYEQRMVQPVRGFEDGSKIFLQTYASFGWRDVEQVTFDIFDTDADDHCAEQWGIVTPVCGRSRSGWSQIDGVAWVSDLERTRANKRLVEAYVTECLIGGDRRHGRYVSTAGYAQHDPELCDGIDAYLHYLDQPGSRRYTRLCQLAGSGNFVAVACESSNGNEDFATCDLYRVEDGRIVEHWGAEQATVVS